MAARVAAALLVLLGGTYYLTNEPAPPVVIRWRPGVTVEQRAAIERRFGLVRPRGGDDEGTTYDLLDPRPANIEELLGQPAIATTGYIDETTFTIPADAPDGAGSTWVLERQVFSPELRMFRVVPAMAAVCVALVVYAIGAAVVTRRRTSPPRP